MGTALELYEARLSYLQVVEGAMEIHFSYACIHKFIGAPGRDSGKSWSQEAVLLLQDAEVDEPLPPLPNVVVDGHLEAGEECHELVPLPFERTSPALLYLEFRDGTTLKVRGRHPLLTLLGEKVFFES